MYTLHKRSAPGWTKKFDTTQELTEEVFKHTCSLCKDSYGTDLLSMLASDCGCEYEVDGISLDEPMTLVEQWQDHYEGLYGK